MAVTESRPVSPTCRVAVVECRLISRLIAAMLAGKAFTVVEFAAAPGRAALDGIDLIVTNRPEAVLDFGFPVLYIAAIPDRCLAQRCAAVLPKPFHYRALLCAIARARGGACYS